MMRNIIYFSHQRHKHHVLIIIGGLPSHQNTLPVLLKKHTEEEMDETTNGEEGEAGRGRVCVPACITA